MSDEAFTDHGFQGRIPASGADAQQSAQQRGSTPGLIRNVVLVHGAFADGSSYAKVIPLLRARGLNVTAAQIPLTSLDDAVAAAKRAIARQDGPVLLVAHSFGGMVISEAGNDPKVAGLVYIAAFVPKDGQSAEDVLEPYPPAPGTAEEELDGDGFLWVTRKGMEENFVPDLPPDERFLVYATQGPLSITAVRGRVPSPAWKAKPSWYVAVNDRMLPPEYELDIAQHIKATTVTLDSGHVPMLSRPEEVAAVIVDAATNLGTTATARAH